MNTIENTLEQVESHFGLVPNFFRISDDAELAAELWQTVKFDYLEAPFPSLFKEKLVTYLSRFCNSSYCMCRHAGFLVGRGHAAGDAEAPTISPLAVLELVAREPESVEDLESMIHYLSLVSLGKDDWNKEIEDSLIACLTLVFLRAPGQQKISRGLSHYFGPQRYDRMIKLLGFVRTAHFWTETHPDLQLEDDLSDLFGSGSTLGEWVANQFDPPLPSTEPSREALDQKLLDLFQHTSDLIQSVAPDGQILFVNRAWLDTLGYSPEKVTDLSIFEVIAPDQTQHCHTMMRQLAASPGTVQTVETVFLTKSGDRIYVEGNASFRFQDGVPVASRGFFRNVTERKQHEAERDELIKNLEAAAAQVSALSRLLPVCSWCKNIRSESGTWHGILDHLMMHPNVQVTHAICPNCAEALENQGLQ